jgi:hypothetical protein
MRRIMWALLLTAAVSCVQAEALTQEQIKSMSNKNIEANLPDSPPAMAMAYSMKLFKANRKDQAVIWYYVGQLRYRFHILSNPPSDAEAAQLEQVNGTFGPAISDWAGRNVRYWTEQIDHALDWDAKQPNATTSKEAHAKELDQARQELVALRDKLRRSENEIRAQRQARGLEVQ